MTHLTLNEQETRFVAELAAEYPGVSRHRITHALFRLGRRVVTVELRHLDDELAEMIAESAKRSAAEQ